MHRLTEIFEMHDNIGLGGRVVRMFACHASDPGSNPGWGPFFCVCIVLGVSIDEGSIHLPHPKIRFL